MLKKIFIVIVSLFFLNFTFADEDVKENSNSVVNNKASIDKAVNNIWTWVCDKYQEYLKILWPKNVKRQFQTNFILWSKNKEIDLKKVQDISWTIFRGEQKILTQNWNIFSYLFKEPWRVFLKASFSYWECDIVLEKEIYIYDKIILSIKWNKVSFISKLWLKEQNIYFQNYQIEDLLKNEYMLKVSDGIMIDQDFVIPFLIKLWEKNIKQIDSKKFVFFISTSKWFFSKLIIPYIKWINKENIYLYSAEQFNEVFLNFSEWKEFDKKHLIASYNIGNKLYFPLSYFVNKLIENWLDIKIFWTVLLALFWTLIVAFFRQIIWFSVFGWYTPLLFAILLITLWYKVTLFLFAISIASIIIGYFFTKKIYILYSAKIALNYLIYVILSIISVWILVKFFWFNLVGVNSSIILSFFVMPLLTKNIIKEDTKIFSKIFFLFVLEFVFIMFILLLIFKIEFLKYVLVAYPDVLWFLMIVIILIGRFTWLQLLEYIRFHPLIKKSMYEE